MKKILLIGILILMPALFLYPQNVERITYMDLGPDGSQRINRTVNAVFAGWEQTETRREGNFEATYESFRLVDGEWSDWVLVEKNR